MGNVKRNNGSGEKTRDRAQRILVRSVGQHGQWIEMICTDPYEAEKNNEASVAAGSQRCSCQNGTIVLDPSLRTMEATIYRSHRIL